MLEVKETVREGEGKQSNFNFNVAFYWVGAALSLSLLTGAIGWSYQLIVRDISQIPIVRAQLGPLRVAPDDPGGLTAANQYPSAYANMYASGVCSGKITPGGKKKRKKLNMGGIVVEDVTRMVDV